MRVLNAHGTPCEADARAGTSEPKLIPMSIILHVTLIEPRRDLEKLPRRFSSIRFSIRQRYDPLKNPHASIDTLGRPQGTRTRAGQRALLRGLLAANS